jgi:hypothetical protein
MLSGSGFQYHGPWHLRATPAGGGVIGCGLEDVVGGTFKGVFRIIFVSTDKNPVSRRTRPACWVHSCAKARRRKAA